MEVVAKRTAKEYRKIDMLSASDLRTFTTDKKRFYKKVIMKEEEKDEYNRSIMIGNLCHLLLLEPQNFDKHYLMSICAEVPTGLMLAFTEALYKHTAEATNETGEVTSPMEALCTAAYADSGFKISLEAVMKKFVGSPAEDYYNELRQSKAKGLEVVCTEDLQIATSIVDTVKGDEFAGPIFNPPADNHIIFNELQVEGFDVYGLPMKAMLDKVKVDHEKMTIQIYDAKIVWDNQNFFREYYLKKAAYIQAIVYFLALYSRKLDLGFDYSKYQILFPIFVAIDSGNFYAPIQYQLTEKDMNDALEGFEERGRNYMGLREIISEIEWVTTTNNWRMSKKAFENNGVLLLN